MENKLLSLIIPAYNVEAYIYFLIQSIIENVDCSLSSFEIIIINDGSEDITLEEIKRAKKDFYRFDIKYVSQNNQGVSMARNVGLSLARGKFVWFIDGDDAIAKVSLCSIMGIIEQYESDIYVIRIGNCISETLYDDNNIVTNYIPRVESSKTQLIDSIEFLSNQYEHGHTVYLWRNEFLKVNDVCYPVGITINEDYNFLFRALIKAKKAVYNPTFRFYFARENMTSVSRSPLTVDRMKVIINCKVKNIILFIQYKQMNKLNDLRAVELVNEYFDTYVLNTFKTLFALALPYNFKKSVLDELNKNKIYPQNCGVEKFLLSNGFIYRYGAFIMKVYLKMKGIIRKFSK